MRSKLNNTKGNVTSPKPRILWATRDSTMGGIFLMASKLAQKVCGSEGLYFLSTDSLQRPTMDKLMSDPDKLSRKCSGIQGYVGCARRLARVIDTNDINVVVGLGYSVGIVSVLSRYFSKSKPRIVIGVRNSIREFEYKNSRRFNFIKVLSVVFLKAADQIILISSGLSDELLSLGISQKKIQVIYNGIDSAFIRKRAQEYVDHPWFKDTKVPIVVSVGRLSRQKNFHLLIESVARINENKFVRCIIVGDGDERTSLEEATRMFGINGSVDFVGVTTNPYPFMKNATVFALTSLYEGFGNVLVEAMACGTPVISTDCRSGPGEIIEDGISGILVPEGDPQVFASELERLIDNKELRARMKLNALSRAEEFSEVKMVNEYSRILCNL